MKQFKGWHCYEELAVGVINPKAVAKLPLTPEMLAELEIQASQKGITLDQYIEEAIEAANKEIAEDKVTEFFDENAKTTNTGDL